MGFRAVEYGDDVDEMWGVDTFEMADNDIEALKSGKVLYTTNGEYATLIRRKQNADMRERREIE